MAATKEVPDHISLGEDSFHTPKLKLITEALLIDFLGGLVPGMLFILAILIALAIPTQALVGTLAGQPHKSWSDTVLDYASNIKQTPSAFWISGFVTFALISFVVGHLFYRNDPKKPDQRSFKKLSKGKSAEDCQKEFGCANEEDCQFPYVNYHAYLEARGLNHLLPLVAWCPQSGGTGKRSKTFINILKIRLRYYFPDKCSIIIWNEAHIRLAASGWYVANTLLVASMVGIAISLWALKLSLDTGAAGGSILQLIGRNASSFLAPVSVLSFSILAKSQIERFLHYQRLREVFFVLETTHTAFRGNYELLSPPLSESAVKALNERKPPIAPKESPLLQENMIKQDINVKASSI